MNRQMATYYWLAGMYLRLAGGEQARWLRVADGPHHRLHGIVFAGNRVAYNDPDTGDRCEVDLTDDFGEVLIAVNDGVARLVRSGRFTAQLVYPDGATVERLRVSPYQPLLFRHALTRVYTGGRLGGAVISVQADAVLVIDGVALPLAGDAAWEHALPAGGRLRRSPNGLVTHEDEGVVGHFVWAAKQRRLLRVDFHRRQLRFVWATTGPEGVAPLLDGIATARAEDGALMLWFGHTKARGEAIDCLGPEGVWLSRAEGSDRVWVFQHDEVVGVADFVPNAGSDAHGEVFHRWAFAVGGYAELPLGESPVSPLVTGALLAGALVVLLALVWESVAVVFAVPAVIGVALAIVAKETIRLIRGAW